MSNSIILNNLRFYAYHGVLAQEKLVGHSFLVSLKIDCDFKQAIYSDSVKDTIDYGKVFEIVKKEMQIPSKLMEHVAGRILSSIYKKFPSVICVSISIIKENPPINSDSEGCGIEIKMTRDDFENISQIIM